jgi:hypothetical protein
VKEPIELVEMQALACAPAASAEMTMIVVHKSKYRRKREFCAFMIEMLSHVDVL